MIFFSIDMRLIRIFSFSVAAVVPKAVYDVVISSNIEMIILDNCGAVVPLNLLNNIITTYMHQMEFHLKINFKTKGIGNIPNKVWFIWY